MARRYETNRIEHRLAISWIIRFSTPVPAILILGTRLWFYSQAGKRQVTDPARAVADARKLIAEERDKPSKRGLRPEELPESLRDCWLTVGRQLERPYQLGSITAIREREVRESGAWILKLNIRTRQNHIRTYTSSVTTRTHLTGPDNIY